MTTAFALSTAVVLKASTFSGRQVSPTRSASVRSTPRMALQTQEKIETKSSFSRLEASRAAKADSEYRGPQGFTPYAEKVNGRLAQMGFVIGLITEIVSGKPIGQQMLIMFSPLTHALQALGGVITG